MGTLLEILADLFLDSLSFGRKVTVGFCAIAVVVGVVLFLAASPDAENSHSATGIGLIIIGLVGIAVWVAVGMLGKHKE